ncbi:Bug family tripartite tricarboxylate transporter substrate binding protein [Bradyrhizobium erythrophlei]|jgi:tripartite-type tricarboxylate transporter receptor subunit TctC|uniref:Tripartite-type tricarboxylate transporter, receptor component TctC n=1 Tax=Bradyrhizobium erythrophlei TaxID=1437360 RepID=A0A1M7T9W7_9BRAD|nr:tripartite tricarboxylate transporter substrate binding protein [Bradyrhizobium erythrophlei]SHN67473.1 Tripartite-type tricarboxylate transporter, receptor component TctC [Bradyrhizobium erythrophlei]
MRRDFGSAVLGGLLACAMGGALEAAPYPDRPITIVVPFGKGTTADLIAAVVAEAVSKNTGQKVSVELKPGAGGGIAMAQVEKAAPDGATLAMITQGTHVFNVSLYKSLPYDPDKIIPITPISAVCNVMTVHPTNPANTPLEVVAAARAAPGQLTYASGGIGTSHHLGGVLFASIAGVDIKHVPHLVSVDGVNKIVNGEITMGFFNLPTVIDQIKAGKLKPLAVTSLTRSSHLPDVPTFDASGLKGYDLVTWFGFGAPAGTPPEIVQRLRDEFAKAAADPVVKAKLDEAGLDPIDQLQPSEFARLIASDRAKWTPIIKAAAATSE